MVPLAGSLHGEEEPVPIGDSNLVVRALQLLQQRSGCRAGACASLVKRIPAAAGLGGGSSDAAAALLLGNRVWRLGWTTERLAELGAELGSDVPFFIYRRAAICRGRGEHVTPLDGVARFHAVVVKPPFGLSTPAVFQAHDALRNHGDNVPGQRPLHGVVESLRRADYSGLGRWMTNQLEAAASTLTPWIREVRAVFDQLGCLGHQLSGSGSAYFGICPHAAEAHRVAAVLKAQQLGMVFVTRSCS
jgi:4-diphosphocytidyl-2-C-methyl-D-erythritol kinase